jgi:mRNA-degrading endonuclease toxin of MazEF toxin-antitoxin module
MAAQYSAAARNAMLDTLNTSVGSSAKIRIYSGTRPATVDTALSGNTVLAELALTTPTPFTGSASGGSISLAAISNDTAADATGTATFASVLTSANVRVIDFAVGTSGSDLNLNTVSLVANAVVSISSMSFSLTA